MKPGEVLTGPESEVAEEMECEMQAREFFVHIGMLIIEGRIPQYSDKGRVEGPHCLSLFSVIPHVCDPQGVNSCQKVLERKEKMNVLWQNSSPMVITVMTQTPTDDSLILLERWTVEAVDGADAHGCNGSMLIQAIRSHIHFSQLSAWLSRSKGSIPSLVIYRICETGEELPPSSFLKDPDFHIFPLANLHSNRALRVSVQSLPRCDIFNFTDEILASKINLLSAGHKQEQKEHKDVKENTISNDEMLRSPLKKKSCMKELETSHHKQTLIENNLTNKEKSLDFSKPSTSRTLVEQVARNCDKNLLISPKISKDNLKAGYLKIRSLSEGTNGANLDGQINQNSCSKIHQPVHNLETKQNCDHKKLSKQYQTSANITIPKGVLQALQSRHVGTGTRPIFNSTTGLPVSSSPAPLRRSATDLDIEDDAREIANPMMLCNQPRLSQDFLGISQM